MNERQKPERRRLDEAKFSTQRVVTYLLILIFAAVTANVLLGADQAERSTILQTVINFTMIAVGYWLGASKTTDTIARSGMPAQQQEKKE